MPGTHSDFFDSTRLAPSTESQYSPPTRWGQGPSGLDLTIRVAPDDSPGTSPAPTGAVVSDRFSVMRPKFGPCRSLLPGSLYSPGPGWSSATAGSTTNMSLSRKVQSTIYVRVINSQPPNTTPTPTSTTGPLFDRGQDCDPSMDA